MIREMFKVKCPRCDNTYWTSKKTRLGHPKWYIQCPACKYQYRIKELPKRRVLK